MRILIIGGTGLISSPMTRQLAEEGHDITLFNRGKRDDALPPGVKTIKGDRNRYDEFEATMREAEPFDCVIDMICYLPDDARSLIRAFLERTRHLIVCSTVDVYEKPQKAFPLREETPFGPSEWDYAENKAEVERILWDASYKGDIPLTIFRPGHTYDDGGTLHHSLGSRTTYLDRLKKGKPIIVHGDGTSFWVACHAVDVARAFVAAAGSERAVGKAYNVAGSEWMTWNQYHEKVAEAIGAPPPNFVHIPTDLLAKVADRAWITSVNFQYDNLIDSSAAERELGFQTTVPFAEGAGRIYRTLESQGRIENSDDDPYDDRIIEAWKRLSEGMIAELSPAR